MPSGNVELPKRLKREKEENIRFLLHTCKAHNLISIKHCKRKMDDEKRILMANALRLISASDEDLFFSSTIANDSPTINDGVPLKNPLIVAGDDDNDNEDDSDGANDSSEKFRCSAKVI